MKCPFWNICPTPNWYGNDERMRSYVEEVCLTLQCKQCTHYMSLEANPPNIQTANMIIKAMKDNPLYKNRYKEDNPSKREDEDDQSM